MSFTSATIPLPCRNGLLDIARYLMEAHPSAGADRSALELRFLAMVERHNALITKICFYFARESGEFDDLRQDTLLNIWRGLPSFRGDSGESTWIYRICFNTCISSAKQLARHTMPGLQDIGADMSEDTDDTDSLIEQLHTCIGRLGYIDKSIIMMQLNGSTYEEIAEVMGMNRNTVATRIARARHKLAQMIENE